MFINLQYFTFKLSKFFMQIRKYKLKDFNYHIDKKIIIYTSEWMLSPLFAYTIQKAIYFKLKGYKVDIFFDCYNNYNQFYSNYLNFLLIFFLKFIKKKTNINYFLPNQRNHIKSIDKEIIKSVELNFSRIKKSLIVNNKTKNFKKKCKTLQSYKFSILKYLEENKSATFFIAGGYYNSSYFITENLKKKNINFYTYDSSPLSQNVGIWYCKNGIAGKLEEIKRSHSILKKKIRFSEIKKIVDIEIKKRASGKDIRNYQRIVKENINKSIISDNKKNILLTLGSGWDANSLNTSLIYKSYISWIIQTIKFLSKFKKSINVIVKDHPDRFKFGEKKNIIKQFLNSSKYNHIKFVNFNEINFYDLLKKIDLTISIASTTIAESVIMNKKSISAGKDVYFFFGSNVSVNTREEYLKKISLELNSKKKMSDIKDMYYVYFYNQIYKYTLSNINPQKYNFGSLNKILNSKIFNLLEHMIINNKQYLVSKYEKENLYNYTS